MHQQLLDELGSKSKLSELDKELCYKYCESITVLKNEILEEAGKIPQYLYYISAGFMRLFYHNDAGDEVTTHLNCPHGFFTPFSHFANQTPSDVLVEAVTDCQLLRVSKPNYDLLIGQSEVWKDYGLFVLQESMAYNENRAKDLATLSAEQRYMKMMEKQPEIIQNIPLQYIASFLGMKPESLSRIRRRMNKN